MKFEIMINILFDLLSKKIVKATDLSNEYNVSVRSIYRYIAALEAAGIPVYTLRGREGGFSIIDTYKLSSTFMTKSEFKQTIDTLSAITESVPNKLLDSAIKKLKSAVKNEYSGFDVKSGNLIIDAGPWGDTKGYKSKLSIIQRSMEETRQLQIRYHDRNASVSERIIEPHVIVFKQGLWYVYTYCNLRKDFRFFKTGRIESANILNTTFTRRDLSKKNLPLDFWHASVIAEPIEMEVSYSVLSDVEEWLGIENIEKTGNKYIARATLPYDSGLVSKIMSYGNGLKVISPEKLKIEIKTCASAIANNY